MLFIGYFSGKWRSDKTTQTCVLSKHYKLELLDICVICVIFCITVYPHLSVHPRRPPGAPYRLSAGLAPYPGRSSSSRPGSTNTSPGSAVTGAPGPGLLPPEPPEPGLLPPEGGRGVREGVGKELEAGLDSPPPEIVKYVDTKKTPGPLPLLPPEGLLCTPPPLLLDDPPPPPPPPELLLEGTSL